jgi:hypothetical protein
LISVKGEGGGVGGGGEWVYWEVRTRTTAAQGTNNGGLVVDRVIWVGVRLS